MRRYLAVASAALAAACFAVPCAAAGDASKSRASDAPDALDAALTNALAGSIVRGGVYWEAYRDPVTTVVLLDKKTGYHLAQWNL